MPSTKSPNRGRRARAPTTDASGKLRSKLRVEARDYDLSRCHHVRKNWIPASLSTTIPKQDVALLTPGKPLLATIFEAKEIKRRGNHWSLGPGRIAEVRRRPW
jgi:hypothetical protein